MIGRLARAVGGAATFTLGSAWPLRWPAFPVALFDFDMFNEPADRLYAETAAKVAAAGAEKRKDDARPFPSVDTFERFLAAMIAGEIGPALALADQYVTEFSHELADLTGVDLTTIQVSSAAGEAGENNDVRSPSAEDGPVPAVPPQDNPPTGTGSPTSAAARVRRLHQQYRPAHVDIDTCAHCNTLHRFPNVEPWPCPTIRALDGADEQPFATTISK